MISTLHNRKAMNMCKISLNSSCYVASFIFPFLLVIIFLIYTKVHCTTKSYYALPSLVFLILLLRCSAIQNAMKLNKATVTYLNMRCANGEKNIDCGSYNRWLNKKKQTIVIFSKHFERKIFNSRKLLKTSLKIQNDEMNDEAKRWQKKTTLESHVMKRWLWM